MWNGRWGNRRVGRSWGKVRERQKRMWVGWKGRIVAFLQKGDDEFRFIIKCAQLQKGSEWRIINQRIVF